VMASIGVVVYYWNQARDEFNWILHFVFPVGTSLVLIYSIYAAFVPLPAAPNNWTPVVAAAWLALGVIILVGMRATGNEAWLTNAAAIVAEREERPGEKHPSL
jgi:hypothetical protein